MDASNAVSKGSSVANWVKLLRIKHWIKNLLVLFPLVFAGEIFDPNGLLRGLAGLLSFCLMSSAIYLFNDLNDVEFDRAHPTKKNRPLANGSIDIRAAKYAIAVLVVCSLIPLAIVFLRYGGGWHPIALLACYAVLNIGYSMGWKNLPIVDTAILASGFVLRVLFGGQVCDVPVSSWLFLTILVFSLYFALGKRRGELRKSGSKSRKILESYSSDFLDKNMHVFLACGIVFYSLWSFERAGEYASSVSSLSASLVLGVPIVMLICLRYSFDIECSDSDGDPVGVVTGDKVLLVLLLLWMIVIFTTLYC